MKVLQLDFKSIIALISVYVFAELMLFCICAFSSYQVVDILGHVMNKWHILWLIPIICTIIAPFVALVIIGVCKYLDWLISD